MIDIDGMGYLFRRTLRLLFLILFLNLFFKFSYAQTQDLKESLVDRERQRVFKEEPQKEKIPETPKLELKKEPEEIPKAAEAEVKFFIAKIKVEGCTVFSQEEINKIISPYQNKEFSLIELKELAEKITQLYHKNGYITSKAYIPPQRIKEKEVIIKVVEGKIGEINITGNKYFKSSFIKSAFRNLESKILNQKDLEKVLIYLNRNPNLEVVGVLEKGKVPETTDIRLLVKDRLPSHLRYTFNNQGTRLTKNLRHILTYTNTNLLGFGDTFLLQVPFAEEGMVKGFSANYLVHLDKEGTDLGFISSLTKVKIGKEFKPSNIIGRSRLNSIYITKPFFYKRKFFNQFKISLESIDSKTTILGEKLFLNRLGVLSLGLATNLQDKNGRTYISNQFDFGFPDFLGALPKDNPLASPRDSDNQFIRYNFSFSRFQILPYSSYLLFNSNLQLTTDVLPSQKRFYLGGADSIRGYPEDDFGGDYGISNNIEFVCPIFIIPDRIKFKEKKLKDLLKFAIFTDFGILFNRGEDEKPLLAGSGFGLRFNINRNITSKFDIGWPLADKPTDRSSYNVHFSLNIEY